MSLLKRPQKETMAIVRKELVGICQDAPDSACAAGILNHFEMLTLWKLKNMPQAVYENNVLEKGGEIPTQNTEAWVWKKQTELVSELLGTWRTGKIDKNRKWLIEQEFLITRSNPKYAWDRTIQYKLNITLINERIELHIASSDFENFHFVHTQNGNGNKVKSKAAKTKNDSESTSKNTSLNTSESDSADGEGKPSDSGSKIDEEAERQEQLQKDIAARTNAYLGIYWGRVTKRQQKPPVTKDRFRQGRYKDMEAIASHDLAITPAEFAKYLDDYIDSNPFFEKNPTAMPKVETIAQQIHIAVDLMRKELYGGVSYGTPINTSESGDNEDNSDERYGKSRF